MKKLVSGFLILFSFTSLFAGPKADILRYEDFGAVGDGVHDDAAAIAAAHNEANRIGNPVRIEGDRTYYIGPKSCRIDIMTSVDFGSVKFIIDDTNTKAFNSHVFLVKSSYGSKKLGGISSLHVGQSDLGVSPMANSLVVVQNSNHKIYIRKGRNANEGVACHEALLVDSNGRIDSSTPLHFDYETVTAVKAYPIDKETLYIKGGTFLTKAVTWGPKLPYLNRNIAVRRSNVVLDGITHYVEGETVEGGAPYAGFVNIANCANIVVKNCVFTPHLIYRFPKDDGTPFTRGTYDITVNAAINVKFINCSQTIDIDDVRYWGVMGTNFARNMYLDGCVFNRYDNHQGVHNLTVKNCTLGYMSIQTNGFGKLCVENCAMRRNMLINLRSDYGSSWQGEVVVKNCSLTVVNPNHTSAVIIHGDNDGTHDFGFDCFLPTKLTVDGLVIDDSLIANNKKYKGPAVYSPNTRKGNLRYIAPPGLVILKNISVKSGKPLSIGFNKDLFKDTQVKTKNCDFKR